MSRREDPLVVSRRLVVPGDELQWRFVPSGGPGGQHANRTASRAELSIDLAASPTLPPDLRDRLLSRLGTAAPGGVVTVSVDESRSQWRNRSLARRRMADLLADALHEPRRRRATRPTAAARRRRLGAKRRRAETKRLRRPPRIEE